MTHPGVLNPHMKERKMKLAIIINSNDPETAWNALRPGNTA